MSRASSASERRRFWPESSKGSEAVNLRALLGVVDREIACFVLPHRDVGKTRAAQERGELLRRILVRILGVDALPGGEHTLTAGDGDALCPARFERSEEHTSELQS